MAVRGGGAGVTLQEVDPFESDTPAGRARVGGDDACDHPDDGRTYLGQMATAAFFRCAACEGVVIEW
jgi:hypothetical protein